MSLIDHLEHLCHAAFAGSTTDVKERTLDGSGARLTALHQAQGLTQDELDAAVANANRMIAYYERDGAQPPGAVLVELAKARAAPEALAPRGGVPAADQRAILKLGDVILETWASNTQTQGELVMGPPALTPARSVAAGGSVSPTV